MNKIAALIVTGELKVKLQGNEELQGKVSELQKLMKTENAFDVAICYGELKEMFRASDIDATDYMNRLYKFICMSDEKIVEDERFIMDIKDFNLSVRAFDALYYWAGITTLDKLLKMSKRELKNLRGIGTVSYNEIINKLSEFGFELVDE